MVFVVLPVLPLSRRPPWNLFVYSWSRGRHIGGRPAVPSFRGRLRPSPYLAIPIRIRRTRCHCQLPVLFNYWMPIASKERFMTKAYLPLQSLLLPVAQTLVRLLFLRIQSQAPSPSAQLTVIFRRQNGPRPIFQPGAKGPQVFSGGTVPYGEVWVVRGQRSHHVRERIQLLRFGTRISRRQATLCFTIPNA